MIVIMSQKRWEMVHKDFRGSINGRDTCVTVRGIEYVEIVPATDSRLDNIGYGRR